MFIRKRKVLKAISEVIESEREVQRKLAYDLTESYINGDYDKFSRLCTVVCSQNPCLKIIEILELY